VGTVPPFSELLAATTRIAAHLETRDAYTPGDPAFLDWKAGKPVPVAAPALRPEPVPEPRGGRCPAELREGGGDLVEARRAGGLDEHNIADGEVAAQPVDGRVVAG
jgi:hypothetical protein